MTKEQLFEIITADSHNEAKYNLSRSGVYCPYSDHRHFDGWMITILVNIPAGIDKSPFSNLGRTEFKPDELRQTVAALQSEGFVVYLDGIDVLAEQEYLSALKQAQQKYAITTGRSIVENPPFIDTIQEAGIETLGVRYNFESHSYFSSLHARLAITALDLAKNKDIKTRVITTITRENISQIPYYCEFCAGQGYDEILFENYCSHQVPDKDRAFMINANERDSCVVAINEQRKKYSDNTLKIVADGYFERCRTQECLACDKSIVMVPSNALYPCKYQFYAGNYCGLQRSGALCVRNDSRPSPELCQKIHLSPY